MNSSAANNQARLHAVVEGRVQGVGFRYFVVEKAVPLELTGWVRNTSDGSVEVMAEGDHTSLETFLEDLRSGPRAALVMRVQQEWQSPTGEFSRFFIARTG